MRTVLKKILTAMRGGVNELGEAVVDGQGNRILEQELRDSEHELKQAKQELASPWPAAMALRASSSRLAALSCSVRICRAREAASAISDASSCLACFSSCSESQDYLA